jgi:hypothetical protein
MRHQSTATEFYNSNVTEKKDMRQDGVKKRVAFKPCGNHSEFIQSGKSLEELEEEESSA